jgi:hypothetical protein
MLFATQPETIHHWLGSSDVIDNPFNSTLSSGESFDIDSLFTTIDDSGVCINGEKPSKSVSVSNQEHSNNSTHRKEPSINTDQLGEERLVTNENIESDEASAHDLLRVNERLCFGSPGIEDSSSDSRSSTSSGSNSFVTELSLRLQESIRRTSLFQSFVPESTASGDRRAYTGRHVHPIVSPVRSLVSIPYDNGVIGIEDRLASLKLLHQRAWIRKKARLPTSMKQTSLDRFLAATRKVPSAVGNGESSLVNETEKTSVLSNDIGCASLVNRSPTPSLTVCEWRKAMYDFFPDFCATNYLFGTNWIDRIINVENAGHSSLIDKRLYWPCVPLTHEKIANEFDSRNYTHLHECRMRDDAPEKERVIQAKQLATITFEPNCVGLVVDANTPDELPDDYTNYIYVYMLHRKFYILTPEMIDYVVTRTVLSRLSSVQLDLSVEQLKAVRLRRQPILGNAVRKIPLLPPSAKMDDEFISKLKEYRRGLVERYINTEVSGRIVRSFLSERTALQQAASKERIAATPSFTVPRKPIVRKRSRVPRKPSVPRRTTSDKTSESQLVLPVTTDPETTTTTTTTAMSSGSKNTKRPPSNLRPAATNDTPVIDAHSDSDDDETELKSVVVRKFGSSSPSKKSPDRNGRSKKETSKNPKSRKRRKDESDSDSESSSDDDESESSESDEESDDHRESGDESDNSSESSEEHSQEESGASSEDQIEIDEDAPTSEKKRQMARWFIDDTAEEKISKKKSKSKKRSSPLDVVEKLSIRSVRDHSDDEDEEDDEDDEEDDGFINDNSELTEASPARPSAPPSPRVQLEPPVEKVVPKPVSSSNSVKKPRSSRKRAVVESDDSDADEYDDPTLVSDLLQAEMNVERLRGKANIDSAEPVDGNKRALTFSVAPEPPKGASNIDATATSDAVDGSTDRDVDAKQSTKKSTASKTPSTPKKPAEPEAAAPVVPSVDASTKQTAEMDSSARRRQEADENSRKAESWKETVVGKQDGQDTSSKKPSKGRSSRKKSKGSDDEQEESESDTKKSSRSKKSKSSKSKKDSKHEKKPPKKGSKRRRGGDDDDEADSVDDTTSARQKRRKTGDNEEETTTTKKTGGKRKTSRDTEEEEPDVAVKNDDSKQSQSKRSRSKPSSTASTTTKSTKTSANAPPSSYDEKMAQALRNVFLRPGQKGEHFLVEVKTEQELERHGKHVADKTKRALIKIERTLFARYHSTEPLAKPKIIAAEFPHLILSTLRFLMTAAKHVEFDYPETYATEEDLKNVLKVLNLLPPGTLVKLKEDNVSEDEIQPLV